jgi:hypothetical protein
MAVMSDVGPSRRAVLAGAGVAFVAGCTSAGEREVTEVPDRVDPDVRVRAAVVAEVRRLASLYDATLAAHPALRPVVEPFRAETSAHLSALGDRGPTTSPSVGGTPAASVPSVAAQAQALLARAERSAADNQVGRLADASPGLARLVASVAASEAVHAVLLTEDR